MPAVSRLLAMTKRRFWRGVSPFFENPKSGEVETRRANFKPLRRKFEQKKAPFLFLKWRLS